MKACSNETNIAEPTRMSTDNGKIITRIYSFYAGMIKAILYERTVVLCASMDLGKVLGRSGP